MSLIVLILLSSLTTFYGEDLNKYPKLNSIEYSLSIPTNTIKIEDEKTKKSIEYSPFVSAQAGLKVSKFGYSLGISFVDPLNKKEIDKGVERSKYFDIRFNKAFDSQIWQIYYQHYSGFKLNSEDISQTNLLGIETINYGVHLNYFLDKNYDPKNGTGHYTPNKKSTWSTLIGIGLSQNSLQSNQTLIPKSLETTLSEYKGLKGIRKNILSIEYGITGQYVYNKYFIQSLVAMGINIGKVHYSGSNLKDTTKSGPSSILNLNLGKEFKNSILGLSITNYNISDKQNDQVFSSTNTQVLAYYKIFF
jgi:hypothetical protein